MFRHQWDIQVSVSVQTRTSGQAEMTLQNEYTWSACSDPPASARHPVSHHAHISGASERETQQILGQSPSDNGEGQWLSLASLRQN